MATKQKVQWTDDAGVHHPFTMFDVSASMSPNQDGVYIFAKLVNQHWRAVYIGQGDLKDRKDAHDRQGDITDHGATHYFARLESSLGQRRALEKGLLAAHPEAYHPTGCNIRTGG